MQRLRPILSSVDFLIILALVILFFFYGYHNLLHLEPQSFHNWRQTDCSAMIWNYYHTTWNFFTPYLMNQILANEGSTVGEFPIFYYISGMLWRLFGPHPAIFRMLNILAVFAGLWAFGKTVLRVTKDKFWAVALPVLLFASPVVVFYTNTPMPEMPSVGLVLIGWFFFFRFRDESRQKDIRWAVFFFALAAAIKLSSGVSLVAAIAIYFIELNDWGKFKGEMRMFSGNIWRYAGYFALGLGFVLSWYLYADWYNHEHKIKYFLTDPYPISEADPQKFNFVMQRFFGFNADVAYFFLTHFVILFLTFLAFSQTGRKHPLLFALSLLSFIGVFMYVMFFFQLFNVHDYYLVAMYIFPVLLFLHAVRILQVDFPKVESSWIFRGIVIILIGINLFHARKHMTLRYYGNKWHFKDNENFYKPEFRDFLDGLGVTADQKVISLPDKSPNSTLYLMRRKGWTAYNVRKLPGDIGFFQKRGAEYLIVSDTTLMRKNGMDTFEKGYVGNFEDVYVYKLEAE